MKNTKKKIACLALASALVIPGAIGLAACEKGHTHAFNSELYYEVVTEGETKIARSWRECSCGAEDAHKKVENAIVATPSTAQSILDNNINGKTIVFDAGEYNNMLELRPSKATATVYTLKSETDKTFVDVYTGELDPNTEYGYIRNFTNVTLAGTANAVFKNYLITRMGPVDHSTPFSEYFYDAVKESSETASAGYTAKMHYNSLNILNMNFSGAKGRLFLTTSGNENGFDNLLINNCKFITDEEDSISTSYTQYNAGCYIVAWKNEKLKNFTFTNNEVNGHYQGLYTQNATNLVVENNKILNTTHNGLAVKSGNEACIGSVKIKNNTINATQDRAIRFGKYSNSTILIENNTFENCVDADNGLIKSDALSSTTYTLKNNTYNGEALADLDGSETTLLVTIE